MDLIKKNLETIEKIVKVIVEGQSIYVALGSKHRLENRGKERFTIIEVQIGDYIDEEDIERIEDDYGR